MKNEHIYNHVMRDFPELFHIKTATAINAEIELNSLHNKFKENLEKITYISGQIDKAVKENKNYIVFSPEENIPQFVQDFFIFKLFKVEEMGDLSVKISW